MSVMLNRRQRGSWNFFLSKRFLSWVSSIALTRVYQFWFPFSGLLDFTRSGLHRKSLWRKPLGGTTTLRIFFRWPLCIIKLLSHLFESLLVILELLQRMQRRSYRCRGLLLCEWLLVGRLGKIWTKGLFIDLLVQGCGWNPGLIVWLLRVLPNVANISSLILRFLP
jgi:hypothetical protein